MSSPGGEGSGVPSPGGEGSGVPSPGGEGSGACCCVSLPLYPDLLLCVLTCVS